MTRINGLGMTATDILVALAEGNPGALRVMMEAMEHEPRVDPDSALAPLGALFAFDTLEMYGPTIWVLYKDICGQDITKVLAVLRSNQLGLVSASEIKNAVDTVLLARRKPDLDPAAILARVQERLPNFAAIPNKGDGE